MRPWAWAWARARRCGTILSGTLLVACASRSPNAPNNPEGDAATDGEATQALGESIPAPTARNWYQPPDPIPTDVDADLECLPPAADSPPTLGSLLRLADCQAAAGQWQAEVLTLRACVQIDPESESQWTIWIRLATRLEQLSHLVGAAKTWLAAAQAQPQHPGAVAALRRGICLAHAADLPTDLEAALELLDDPPFEQPRPSHDELVEVCAATLPEPAPSSSL